MSLNQPADRSMSVTTALSDKRTNIDREIRGPGADTLGWYDMARRLGSFLLFNVETPLTIGIQGDWGSGKSSFINLVEASLGTKKNIQNPVISKDSLADYLRHYEVDVPGGTIHRHAYVLRFDSWVFAQSPYSVDELFPIYVTRVIEDYLLQAGKIRTDEPMYERVAKVARAAALTWVGTAAGEAASAAMGEVIRGVQPSAVVSELASFKQNFQELVNQLLDCSSDDCPNRLLIVVDDLDRIMPKDAVELTEKIKVFLDVHGVIFVLAADLSIIQQGLEQKFGAGVVPAEGKNYLDKIVKIQYNVPQLQPLQLADLALGYDGFRYAFGLTSETNFSELFRQDYFKLLTLFPSIAGNIRNSKRVLLNFEFSYYLIVATVSADPEAAFRLLAITVLYQYDHDLARKFNHWLADSSKQDDQLVSMNPSSTLPPGFFSGLDDLLQAERREVMGFFNLLLEQNYTVGKWRDAFAATALTEPIKSS